MILRPCFPTILNQIFRLALLSGVYSPLTDERKWTSEDKKDWEIFKYYNWAQDFDSRQDEIKKIYNNEPSEKFIRQWMWFELETDEDIDNCNTDPDADFALIDTEYVLYEKTPCPDKTIQKIKSQAHYLISKYTKLAIKYCQEFIENGEQSLSREELEILLTQELSKNRDTLGSDKKHLLPEEKIREIWKKIPEDIRRPRGVKTTPKRKFELKAGALPWQQI